ncbi:MAG TPA: lipid II flippase MurJ [Mycobacteriales bacterium]|nr:lipid II flippase MurJ [Mycobacteriales bacterium]
MNDSRRVVRQSGLTSAAALIAVASGLVLDIVIAAGFGAGRGTDAFAVAARLPLGLMAMLMVVGNQALVPTFSTWLVQHDGAAVRRRVSTMLAGAVGVGAVLAGILALLAAPLTAAMAPGFDSEQHTLAAGLATVMVFVIPLTAGSETLRAYLNARYSFVMPALMTVALNVAAATTVLIAGGNIHILPIAYLIGAAVQFVVMFGFACYQGFRPTLRLRFDDPEIRAAARLTVRPFAGSALNPAVRIVELFFASFLPVGSATILHYGNRLVSAIGGTVLFRSVIVAIVPRLSRAVAEGRDRDVRSLTALGVRIMLTLSLPLTAVMAALGEPAARAVFDVGRFGPAQARLLGLALAVYAVSLVGSAMQRAQLAPYMARRDTRTPLRNTVYGALANVVLLPVLVLPLRGSDYAVLAIALAYSLSQYVNVAHAWWRLRADSPISLRAERPALIRVACGSLAAGGVMIALSLALDLTGRMAQPTRIVLTGLAAVAGMVVYLAVERAMSRRSPQAVLSALRRPESAASQPVPGLLRGAVTSVLALVATAVAADTAVGLLSGASRVAVIVPFAICCGLAMVVLAMARLEWFVLVVLATRSSMDAIKFGQGTSLASPASILALMMFGTVGVWLLVQHLTAAERVRWSPALRAVVGFAAVALIGIATSEHPAASAVEWLRLASAAPMLLIVERIARDRASSARVLGACFVSILVPVVVAAGQIATGRGFFVASGFDRVRGTFLHSNPFAIFLVLLLVMAAAVLPIVSGRWRIAAIGVLALGAPALLETYTRTGWIGAVVGIVVVGWFGARKLLGALIALMIVVVIAVPSVTNRFSDLGSGEQDNGTTSNSLSWRFQYWTEALDLSEESPISGDGLKAVAETTTTAKQPHNDYVRAYVELGVAGLFAYLFMLTQLIRTGWWAAVLTRGRHDLDRAIGLGFLGVSVAFALMSLTSNLISQVVLLWYLMALAGLATGVVTRAGRPEPATRELVTA